MAQPLITKLPKGERQAMLDEPQLSDISEIKSICKRYSIPYRIAIETWTEGEESPKTMTGKCGTG